MSVSRKASPSATRDDVISHDARTILRLRRVMAVFTGLLVASTWPLWTPGTAFPDIPWFAWAVGWPPEEWDWLWLAALGGLLVSQFVPRSWEGRRLLTIRCVLFAGAVMLLPTDQHRLQPWAWQMLICGAIIGFSPSDRLTVRLLRWMTISIYFWSAVSKFDWAFINGLFGPGQRLLDGLADAIDRPHHLWPRSFRRLVIVTFPTGELLVAMLMVSPRTRRYGVWSAIAMHGLLMLTLGPLGLQHEWGVFVWNGFFGTFVWILFRDGLSTPNVKDHLKLSAVDRIRRLMVVGLAGIICVVPSLSQFGLWDWWPSWAVYSARPKSVIVYVSDEDLTRLSPIQRECVINIPSLFHRPMFSLDGWSYRTCWCPIYPQERYRMAVIHSGLNRKGLLAEVAIGSTPDRWTGKRDWETLSFDDVSQSADRFWFNTHERGSGID